MMKDYIYNRIKQAKERIDTEITSCVKYRKAKDIDYKAMRERVMAPMNIKTMPGVYKNEVAAIFDFCYQREVSRHYLYPVIFEGKLYSKWDNMPEACKQELRDNKYPNLENRPYPVFTWHFSEGMDAE